MQLADLIAQTGGLQSIARELGITEGQARSGAAALAPALLGGLKKTAQAQPSGATGLGELLDRLGGGGLLDNVLAPQPTDVRRGDAVLGEIFGTKDVSRAVAQNASAQTGLDASVLKKMLPMLAMLVAGYLSKQKGGTAGGGGGLGGMIGDMLGAGRPGSSGAAPRAGGLAGILDMDGDGNPLDDILRMAGKLQR